jgi:TolA-binding protein
MAREIPPATASDEPVYEIDSFELLWEQHKGKIIGGAIALVAIIVGVFGWLILSHAQRVAAEKAYGAAKTPADYRAIIDKYPRSPLAGNASLLLASALRGEKKYDEANQVLGDFVKRQPEHPFAPLAEVAAAVNSALAGKPADAESQLQAVATGDAKSFVAPFALTLEAELQMAGGKRAQALETYRELTQTYPASISARVATSYVQALEALQPAGK